MHRIYKNFNQMIKSCGPSNSVENYHGTDRPEIWWKTDDPRIIEERSKTYTYKWNDHGFRGDDFSRPSEFPIVFLGCSFTDGTALEIEQTWPYILLDKIKTYMNKKIPLWNLGAGGSSIDKQALLLAKYHDLLKPKLIFFLIPNLYRRLFCSDNEIIDYLPAHRSQLWRPDDVAKKIKKFDHAFIQEDYAAFESYKNLLLINQIADKGGAKVYWESWCQEDDYMILKTLCGQLPRFHHLHVPIKNLDYARDASHPGPMTHRNYADNAFYKINFNDFII